MSTQNWLKTSMGCILNISIPVPYSFSMHKSAICIIGNLIVLKTNSPVSELSSDIFGLQHLTCFLAGIFCALRNHNQYASAKQHHHENLKRFGTSRILNVIRIWSVVFKISNHTYQETYLRFLFCSVYLYKMRFPTIHAK